MKSVLAPVVAAAIAWGSLIAAPAAVAAPGAASAYAIRPVPCQPVSVDTARVVPNIKAGEFILVVTGNKPATNIAIEFMPLVYDQKPDYWEIGVLGCPVGIGLQVITPYTAKFDVTSYVGTAGILVKGADSSIKIDLWVAPK